MVKKKKPTLKQEAENPTVLSRSRKRLFTALMLALPLLFFGLLEGGLQLYNYGGELNLFIPAPESYSEYLMCNPRVARRYFVMQGTIPDPPNDLFLKEKPENGYRIFVMGGSTAAGYPYGNNIMFSRILQWRLQDVFPERTIEVINTAMTAINTYSILDLLDEVLEKQPDAILIYSGHNEFYGALGAGSNEQLGNFRGFVKLYLKLQKARTFLLLRDILAGLRNWTSRLLYSGDLSNPSGSLMERMVGEQTIPLHSPLYLVGRRQFENNLRDILYKTTEAGVPVILSELVSNVRDHKPFISVIHDSLPGASAIYERAAGQRAAGNFQKARELYERAKDLDALRFRATEDFNEVVRTLGAELEIPVAPMKSYFINASPDGLVGNNLMLEHLHPNNEGYFLMAEAFFDAMQRHDFIVGQWPAQKIKPAEHYRENWGFTALDKAYADIRIAILKGNWPFRPKVNRNNALVDYEYKTKADSIALKCWKEKSYNLERGHVELAKYYEAQGQLDRAVQEYRALIHTTPFNDSPFLHAAQILIESRRLSEALPYLHDALKRGESAYANKWLGQIYLDQGKKEIATPFLEKAVELSPGDAQLVYNLSGAYALSGRYEDAKRTLVKLHELAPDFPGAADLKQQLERL